MKTILIVEDDASIAMTEKIQLEIAGYEVKVLSKGEEAVSYLADQSRKVDLVLMDIDLGSGIDGAEAARRILAFRDIPVVFISAHSDALVIARTDSITSYGYIAKNSAASVVLASIGMAFKLFDAYQDIARQKRTIEIKNEELEASRYNNVLQERQFAELFNKISIGLIVISTEDQGQTFVLRDLNPSAERINKLPRSSALGLELKDALPGIKDMALQAVINRVWKTGKSQDLQASLYSDDKVSLLLKFEVYKLPLGQIVMVYEDVTQERLAELEIRRLNRLYSFVSQINQMVTRTKTKELILTEACRIAVDFGQFHFAWAALVDQDSNTLNPLASSGSDKGYVDAIANLGLDLGQNQSTQNLAPALRAVWNKELVVCNDIDSSENGSTWANEAYLRDFRSCIAMPVLVNQQVLAVFSLYTNEIYYFNESELKLVEGVCRDLAYAISVCILEDEKVQDAQALKANEERYRLLFESIAQGFALHQVIENEQGIAVSYRFLSVNPAFEKMTGIKAADIVGKSVHEVFPQVENHWLEAYSKVAQTGEPIHMENYSADIGKHFETWVYSPQKGRFAVVFSDITARKIANESLKNLISQKEILLKELQHRVKNNLSVVSSLLYLEKNQLKDEHSQVVFTNAISRIQTMAGIYEQLSLSEQLGTVDLSVYLGNLARMVLSAYRIDTSKIKLECKVEPIHLDSSRAVLLGLIANELIANAVKYAFTKRKEGCITIMLKQIHSNICLTVFDNGDGMPEPVHANESKSIGLDLVRMLADQLQASLYFYLESGSKIVLEFAL